MTTWLAEHWIGLATLITLLVIANGVRVISHNITRLSANVLAIGKMLEREVSRPQ